MKLNFIITLSCCFIFLFSCKKTENIANKSTSSPISKGTNRIVGQVLETQKTDNVLICELEVLEVQGSGGSVKTVAKSQKIKVRISDSFKDLYAKNEIQIDEYFQKNKQITITIKPYSKDESFWNIVELNL